MMQSETERSSVMFYTNFISFAGMIVCLGVPGALASMKWGDRSIYQFLAIMMVIPILVGMWTSAWAITERPLPPKSSNDSAPSFLVSWTRVMSNKPFLLIMSVLSLARPAARPLSRCLGAPPCPPLFHQQTTFPRPSCRGLATADGR